ncbi:hypothetical protein ACVB8X_04675 [Streptomyces sp. NRAIS4]
MGFGTYARRVRDERLPLPRRYTALRCAVGQYCPLGFNATWAYLAAMACPSPDLCRDPAAMIRALDTLEAGRAVRLAQVRAFAARRRVEKAAGRRTPRSADTALLAGPYWPGASAPERLGLIAAVANRHADFKRFPPPDESRHHGRQATHHDGQAGRLADQAARLAGLHARLDACATAYLTGLGRMDRPARKALADCLDGIRALLRPGHAPLNSHLLVWQRFAVLLAYAADMSGGAPPES